MKKNLENFRLCEEFNPDVLASGSDNFSKGSKELMLEAQKENAEAEQQRKKEGMKRQLAINNYEQAAAAIKLRRDTAYNNASKKELKERTALNAAFATEGGEVKDLQKALKENENICRKEKEAADSNYCAAVANLQAQNPEGYRNSQKRWDY